ncbi:MAG: hypothetical protein SFU25_00190 [Candidatus Caenarcaniphilales bacterium]|nr:hypothetical protein [Candidatus Caenarcaniphilales bacterium]
MRYVVSIQPFKLPRQSLVALSKKIKARLSSATAAEAYRRTTVSPPLKPFFFPQLKKPKLNNPAEIINKTQQAALQTIKKARGQALPQIFTIDGPLKKEIMTLPSGREFFMPHAAAALVGKAALPDYASCWSADTSYAANHAALYGDYEPVISAAVTQTLALKSFLADGGKLTHMQTNFHQQSNVMTHNIDEEGNPRNIGMVESKDTPLMYLSIVLDSLNYLSNNPNDANNEALGFLTNNAKEVFKQLFEQFYRETIPNQKPLPLVYGSKGWGRKDRANPSEGYPVWLQAAWIKVINKFSAETNSEAVKAFTEDVLESLAFDNLKNREEIKVDIQSGRIIDQGNPLEGLIDREKIRIKQQLSEIQTSLTNAIHDQYWMDRTKQAIWMHNLFHVSRFWESVKLNNQSKPTNVHMPFNDRVMRWFRPLPEKTGYFIESRNLQEINPIFDLSAHWELLDAGVADLEQLKRIHNFIKAKKIDEPIIGRNQWPFWRWREDTKCDDANYISENHNSAIHPRDAVIMYTIEYIINGKQSADELFAKLCQVLGDKMPEFLHGISLKNPNESLVAGGQLWSASSIDAMFNISQNVKQTEFVDILEQRGWHPSIINYLKSGLSQKEPAHEAA